MKMIGKYRKAVRDLHATHSTSRFPAGVCVCVCWWVCVCVCLRLCMCRLWLWPGMKIAKTAITTAQGLKQ